MKKVYLDFNATTPTDPAVVETMLPFFNSIYGNPSSIHSFGQEAKRAVESARNKIADAINASSKEIIFVSGGTEADNMALKGIAYANSEKGKHIITSTVEHEAILNTCHYLEKEGYEVTYLDVDQYGVINPYDVKRALRRDSILVSIIHGNNEVGTINDIVEIGDIVRNHGAIFHSDAVQTFSKFSFDMALMNIDLLSISAHKIYGPKGIGVLYVRRGIIVQSLLSGGSHEFEMRAGTENVPNIVGFGKAVEIAYDNIEHENNKLFELRDYFWQELESLDIGIILNGHPTNRTCNTVNVSFPGIDNTIMLNRLNLNEIAVSIGSACSSGSMKASHVLSAMNLGESIINSSIRFSIGKYTTKDDIDYTVSKVKSVCREVDALTA